MTLIRFVMPLALAVHIGIAAHAAGAEDKAIEVIVAARSAIGGSKLEGVKSISATGEYRRLMGEREINGETTIEIIVPDKIKRTEEMGIAGGPTMSRTVVLDGSDYWEDTTNRGGNFMRFGGPGRPGGPGGQGPSEADRERFRQMAQRRLQGELQRYLFVWLARTDAQMTYGGEAEAEDGKADVIDVKTGSGTPMRVFFDQETHLPLMLTYEGPQPRMMVRRSGGAPGAHGRAAAGPRRDAPADGGAAEDGHVRGAFLRLQGRERRDAASPDVPERRRQADRGMDGEPVQGEPEPQARIVRQEEQALTSHARRHPVRCPAPVRCSRHLRSPRKRRPRRRNCV